MTTNSCIRETVNLRQPDMPTKQGLTIVETQCHTQPPLAISSDETTPLGAVHMIGSHVMNEEQKEEDTWDASEDLECPPMAVEFDTTIPEAQAVVVDELREAKLMEIYNAPLVEGELLSPPGYAKWMLPMSMACALLSCVAIAGMAVFVFVVESPIVDTPIKLDPISATLSPTLSPDHRLPLSTQSPSVYDPDWPIVPEVIESDGESSSASSTSAVSFFAMLVTAIILTALCSVAFLICFCRIRTQLRRRNGGKHLENSVSS